MPVVNLLVLNAWHQEGKIAHVCACMCVCVYVCLNV